MFYFILSLSSRDTSAAVFLLRFGVSSLVVGVDLRRDIRRLLRKVDGGCPGDNPLSSAIITAPD